MNRSPKVGDAGELRFVVEPQHTIDMRDRGLPVVLSTPHLIWFLEHTARQVLLPLLDASEACVGSHVDVQHLAATPLGQEVVCVARVIHVEGRAITFQVEARDEQELIARGVHKRSVIDAKRFTQRLAKKQRPE